MRPSHGTVDPAGMRSRNSRLVLHLIWRKEHVSRAEIARETGLSPSTVSAIVAELEHARLVRSSGTGASRGGRRPTLVTFCDDAFTIVGLELGASHVTAVLLDLRGRVLAHRSAAHPVRQDPSGALARARRSIDECLKSARAGTRLLGIGVAVPSPVHPETPGRLSPVILPAWQDLDVQASFAERYEVPVMVDNDANLGALAEHWWGARGDDLTYIKLGTGIGSGHVIRGELDRGAGGTAGEIGHLAIDPSGPPCLCGLRGCLVTLIGGEALSRRAHELFRPAPKVPVAVGEIARRAVEGDADARLIIDEVGTRLGLAVAGLLNLLNPSIVVLGGEITAVGDLLLDPLRASVRERALCTPVAETRIVTSDLGDRAIAVGAATQVLHAALRNQALFGTAAEGDAA